MASVPPTKQQTSIRIKKKVTTQHDRCLCASGPTEAPTVTCTTPYSLFTTELGVNSDDETFQTLPRY